MNTIITDGMLERRPMQPQERALWTRATQTAAHQKTSAVCVTCGKRADKRLGSLANGRWYCEDDLKVAHQRSHREAMRDGR